MYSITKRPNAIDILVIVHALPNENPILCLIVLRYLFKLFKFKSNYLSSNYLKQCIYYLRFYKFKQGVSGPLDPPLKTYLYYHTLDLEMVPHKNM